ncbi:MAG: hypothetical protein QOJ89_2857 [bacterium]
MLGIVWMLALALSPTASASPLTTLRHDGGAVVRDDPYLPAASEPARGPVGAGRAGSRAAASAAGRTGSRAAASAAAPGLARLRGSAAATARAPKRTVRSELARMLAAGAIDQATHDARLATYAGARRFLRRLRGARRAAMGAVITNLDQIAARGDLDATRLPELFETVARNREWWSRGPLLSYGSRVSFEGSPLVWQYYTGEGLQIQWLGTFGKANALWTSRTHDEDLRTLLDAAIGLAAQRAGGIAFEYLFDFDGGHPPWVSGLAQGTAVQALSRAAVRLGEPRFFQSARAALGVFREAPPAGVRANTPVGAHYLIYSFAPSLRVLNAFTQAVNGLHDFALLANDVEGRALFAAGEAQLRAELGAYDTGAWSRYSLQREADLSYHKLARDFLENLCTRLEEDAARPAAAPAGAPAAGAPPAGAPVTGAPPAGAPATGAPPTGGALPGSPAPPSVQPVLADPTPYCAAATRFTSYLRQPPVVALASRRARAGKRAVLKLTLSKPAYVKLAVVRGGRTVAVLNARLGSGRRALVWSRPRTAGEYTVMLRATDLAGNVGSARGELEVLRAARKKKR